MIFLRFLILICVQIENNQVNAHAGRVKRGATINCDIVVVDCNWETIEISLNETCRSQEYQVVPSSGAGLFVTNSKIFNSNGDLQSAGFIFLNNSFFYLFFRGTTQLCFQQYRARISPKLAWHHSVCRHRRAGILKITTKAEQQSVQSLNGIITSSGWLHFSPAEVDFEIKLMEPVQIECYFDRFFNISKSLNDQK